MQIIISSGNQIDLNEDTVQRWQADIATSLDRFRESVTRVEVHLKDENSKTKGGVDDIRCLMEARPANRQPVSIEVRASSPEQAIRQGADTLKRRLDTVQDKLRSDRRN
jgi:ribosome-associated translation inhibitor RaiA